jgi:glycosyltransferase involved in cell wall biosynthesis
VNYLYPGGRGGEWCQPQQLALFLAQLQRGNYTHVWLMQDTFLLSKNGFPEALKAVCDAQGIVSCLYFPVDAPLDPEWTKIVAAVDVAVAYTEYGKQEALVKGDVQASVEAALRKAGQLDPAAPPLNYAQSVAVLPHGVGKVYRVREDRLELREKLWPSQWVKPGDFLMLNVNANQRRKDVGRSLEILAALQQRGVPAKLVMHMAESSGDGLSLNRIAEQLGLRKGEDWGHHGQMFHGSQTGFPEEGLVQLYNAADLYLTTTLGEGWGLGITEALACGCPVAMPMHTACREIATRLDGMGMGDRIVRLRPEAHGVFCDNDNSRMRFRVDVDYAATAIHAHYARLRAGQVARAGLNPAVRGWLSWDRIAQEFLRLMRGVKKEKAEGGREKGEGNA